LRLDNEFLLSEDFPHPQTHERRRFLGEVMHRRIYVLGALAALALVVMNWPFYRLLSDFQNKEEQITKHSGTKFDLGQNVTLSEVEAIMGRKPDEVCSPCGPLSTWRWSWLDAETGERIDVEGFTLDNVFVKRSPLSPSPQPNPITCVRACFGW
jgi:hypothetical protein